MYKCEICSEKDKCAFYECQSDECVYEALAALAKVKKEEDETDKIIQKYRRMRVY